MPEASWIILPFLASLGSGVLSFIVAKARMEAAQSRDREELVEARARLVQQEKGVEDRVLAAQAEARRKAFDEFLADVRVEERHYVREIDSPDRRRKRLVLQERVCFRNIPLSQWIERELPLQEEPLPVAAPEPALALVPNRRRLLR